MSSTELYIIKTALPNYSQVRNKNMTKNKNITILALKQDELNWREVNKNPPTKAALNISRYW